MNGLPFWSSRWNGPPTAAIAEPTGDGARPVTKLGASVGSPTWSPDSRQIAFSTDARTGRFAIYRIALNGKGALLVSGGNGDSVSPDWSPDGGSIAFSRDGAIVVTAVGGGAETVVTNPKDNDSQPDWNPVPAPAKKT